MAAIASASLPCASRIRASADATRRSVANARALGKVNIQRFHFQFTSRPASDWGTRRINDLGFVHLPPFRAVRTAAPSPAAVGARPRGGAQPWAAPAAHDTGRGSGADAKVIADG